MRSAIAFPSEPTIRRQTRLDEWFMIGADGRFAVPREFRREGDSLVADVTLPKAGGYLGVMTSKSRTAPMKAAEFTEYASRRRAGECDRGPPSQARLTPKAGSVTPATQKWCSEQARAQPIT